MTKRAKELLQQALTLPPEERVGVAAELLASLEEADAAPGEIEAEWAAEIERRAARVHAGEFIGIPWNEVRRRADAEVGGE